MTAEKQLKEKVSYRMGPRNARWPVNGVPSFYGCPRFCHFFLHLRWASTIFFSRRLSFVESRTCVITDKAPFALQRQGIGVRVRPNSTRGYSVSPSPESHLVSTASRTNLRDLLAITKAVKAEFRVERTIAIAVVSVALAIGLVTAVRASMKGQWDDVGSILFGAGGICTVGVAAIFYMYNRSLLFMERMAGAQKGRKSDE